MLIFVPGCAVAAWWQVTRAADGNQLSYLYMVMWPIFGLLGIYFWWLLVHTDYDMVGLKGMRNRETSPSTSPSPDGEPAASVPVAPAAAASPIAEDLDPDLAAYSGESGRTGEEGSQDLASARACRRPPDVTVRFFRRLTGRSLLARCSGTS